MRIPMYILTIDAEGGQRKTHCVAQFEQLNLTPIFVQGMCWKTINRHAVYSYWKNLVFSKRSLSAQEIAVYSGHRKIWAQIVAGQAEVAFVAEDDLAVIDPATFLCVLENASDTKHWDILKLFDFAPKKVMASQDWHGLRIVDYKYPASGCVAYFITRDAAKRLLNRKRFYRAVDEDISWCWEFDLRVRSVSPNIVAEVSHNLGGSLIEDGRSTLRRRKNLLRRAIGMVWALVKEIRAHRHLKRIFAKDAALKHQTSR